MAVNFQTNPPPTPAPRDDRSVGELVAELFKETTTLFQQEINLAKTEMTQKVQKAGVSVGSMAVGGAVLYAGLLTIIAALVLTLHHFTILDPWVSAWIIGLLVTVVGGVMVKKGIDGMGKIDPVPHQTVQSLKEDAQWAKEQMQ